MLAEGEGRCISRVFVFPDEEGDEADDDSVAVRGVAVVLQVFGIEEGLGEESGGGGEHAEAGAEFAGGSDEEADGGVVGDAVEGGGSDEGPGVVAVEGCGDPGVVLFFGFEDFRVVGFGCEGCGFCGGGCEGEGQGEEGADGSGGGFGFGGDPAVSAGGGGDEWGAVPECEGDADHAAGGGFDVEEVFEVERDSVCGESAQVAA